MKPKVSTGYLTPQAKKKKNVGKARLSDTEENPSDTGFDENLFSALMKCPEKKKMILKFLASNKEAIEKYKKDEGRSTTASPIDKLKSKKPTCESPTALLRRRALEQMNGSPSSTNSNSGRSKISSKSSDTSSHRSASPCPFDKVLNGVVAYVEIKNKEQDRSSGAKEVLKSMGAKVRDKFTNDVTHVIFKDGCFNTYQKAKLLKVHLVSILWVEFCRKSMTRQPERQYPALKSGFHDNETSIICSQMQKEYEDIIRDEYRKSIMQGTPLPSTRSLIDRRRTLMTPSVSNLNSSSSFQTAEESLSSEEISDREVAAINGFENSQVVDSECLVINDPDCFSQVSGPMVNAKSIEKRNYSNSILKTPQNNCLADMDLTQISTDKLNNSTYYSRQNSNTTTDSDMELTTIFNSDKTPKTIYEKNDFYTTKTPKLVKKDVSVNLFNRRKTICNSLLSSDSSTTSIDFLQETHNNPTIVSSDKLTDISQNPFAIPKLVKKSKRSSSSLFSSNEIEKTKRKSSESCFLQPCTRRSSSINLRSSSDSLKHSNDKSALSALEVSDDKTSPEKSFVSSLHVSSGSKKKITETSTMCSLRISSESREASKQNNKNNISHDSGQSIMSSLHISSEKVPNNLRKRENEHKKNIAEGSTMSSLRISSESREAIKQNNKNIISHDSGQSIMSSLHISSEKVPNNLRKRENEHKKNIAEESTMSSLRISSESRESIKQNNKNIISHDSGQSKMSSLNISSEKVPNNLQKRENEHKKNITEGSTMSSLRISSESREPIKQNNKNIISHYSGQSIMSSLDISSEKVPNNLLKQQETQSGSNSFLLTDDSGSINIKHIVEDVISKLQTPECKNTQRKSTKNTAPLSTASISSDDSEILSPTRRVRKIRHRVNKNISLEDSTDVSDKDLTNSRELELLSSVTKRRKTVENKKNGNAAKIPRQERVPENNDRKKGIKSNVDQSDGHIPKNRVSERRKTLGTRNINSNFKTPEQDRNKILFVNIEKSPLADIQHSKSKENKKTNLPKNPKKGTKKSKDKTNSNKNDFLTSDESNNDSSSKQLSTSDDSSDVSKSKKKFRKLYNPDDLDDPVNIHVDDEEERRRRRREVRKRKSDEGVGIEPLGVFQSLKKRVQPSSDSSMERLDTDSNGPSPVKKKKEKKNQVKQVALNSSADEQKELLEEVVNKKKFPVISKTPKTDGKGRSLREKTPVQTPSRRKSTRLIKSTQKTASTWKIPITPINRRSTLDFVPKSTGSSKKAKKVEKMKPTIVCTKLHNKDVQVFTQIVKKLGRFAVEDEVSSRTTHLVAGEAKRTINMLRAISRGCWVLKFDWVLNSLEKGKWLQEEDFEVHDFSPATQKCRLQRQAFGPTYTLDVFENCPPIYVAPSTTPRCSDLKELITTCKGRVVTAPRMAKIVVGEYCDQEDTVSVNETWVLDCITFNKTISFKQQYLIKKKLENKRKSIAV